jgi:glycosyltransferase involved in cell wall biosynthesis
LNVLHLSTSDIEGGAARAAYRLHQGLLGFGVRSQMHVQCKCGNDPLVTGSDTRLGRFAAKLFYLVDSLPVILSRRRRGATFSPAIFPDRLARHTTRIAPDIVHLHWIAGGFMKIETLSQFDKPIVWTLHDMWPFTGGCHFAGECSRYSGSCGCCPELDSSVESDLSRRIWRRKAQAWRDLPLAILTPSRWMAECATASSLFLKADIRVIPNGIDTTLFHPLNRLTARKILGLPQNKRLILFGAMSPTADPRKGFQHLLSAVKDLAKSGWGENTELLVYGANKPQNKPDFGMNASYMGHVSDEKTMVLLNAAADVCVAPSIQDNLPNTVMEALACGTPVVAFRIGGLLDMIDHGETGWLAHPFDHRDLAKGIVHVIEDAARREVMGRLAREKVIRDYAESIVARRHMDLYEELLG